ncbi:hypothetical protein HKX48_004147 [Thoreauomyces humboldtii]|nr:hypothetical protein HKX48_004147 [Thoreauomyces humboldtii]
MRFNLYAAALWLAAAVSAFPHVHISPRQSSLLPSLPDTCTDVFGTTAVSSFTRPLYQIGDGWLQAFIAPINGSLCALSFAVQALAFSAGSANLALYDESTPGTDIFAGNATGLLASANSSTTGDRLVFTFCGTDTVDLVADTTYTFALSLTNPSLPGVPLSLVFADVVSAAGNFYGPSFSPVFNVVDEGIVFNLTTSSGAVTCAAAVTDSISTTDAATATVATTPETPTIDTSSSLSSETTPSETTATTTVEETITTSESTTTADAETTATTETPTETEAESSPTSTSTSTPCPSQKHAWKSCRKALAYVSCVDSPTLTLCQELACAPRQDTKAYLKQCEQLDIWARFTHSGTIPPSW